MNIESKIDELSSELISSTQQIIKIKGIEETDAGYMAPYGEGVKKTLECALQISHQLGFRTTNLDGYAGFAEYGDGEDYIAVLGHVDLVPEGDGWLYPPYGGEIHDGKLYGRGAIDDKGPIMAALYGLKAIMDLRLPLTHRVRIIFGTNEETGCDDMKYYLTKEKLPLMGFTPDADYPIIHAEKGLTIFDIVKKLRINENSSERIVELKGGLRVNMVPDFCEAKLITNRPEKLKTLAVEFAVSKGYDIRTEIKDCHFIIKSYGKAAHGSTPEQGKNAILQLFAFIESINMENCDILEFIKFCNKNIGMNPYGELFGCGLEDEPSGKLSFNTGIVELTGDKIVLSLNLRYPVTYTFEDMMIPFNKRLEGTGIVVENFENDNPLYMPKDHPLIQKLQKVYTKQTGEEARLLAIGGGTYAKSMDNIVAFGPLFPGQPELAHQTNEYIELKDLILNAKIYAHAIYELAK